MPDQQPQQDPGGPEQSSSAETTHAGPADAGTQSGNPPARSLARRVSLWSFADNDPRVVPPWFRRAVIMVLLLVVLAQIAIWAFGQLTSLWYMLFVAFFLGLAIEPVVNRLAARGVRRGLGTFIVLGGLITGGVIFFAVFGNLLVTQLVELVRSIPAFTEDLLDWINRTFDQQLSTQNILEQIGIEEEDIANYARQLGTGLIGLLGSAIGMLFTSFTVLLFTFYFAADGPSFRRMIASWLPPQRQRTFLTVWEISTQKAGGYVISRGIMALVSAIFHGAVFLVLDVPYWLPMALWVGVVSQFVPTIGTYLAIALPTLLSLVEGSPVDAVIIVVAGTIYQQIENYFVQPRITQSTLQIHAAVAFGSVIAGATLFGATGALLAIPVVAAAQSIISVYGRRYELVPELADGDGGIDINPEGMADDVQQAMRAANE